MMKQLLIEARKKLILDKEKLKKIEASLPDTIYIVSYGLEIFDPQDQIRSTLKTNDYQLTQGDSFNKVGIEKWEKKN